MPSTPFQIKNPEGHPIHGDVHKPEGYGEETPVVVIVHGFKGFKDWGFFPYVCDELANGGFTTVRFNLSHNGVSDGSEDFDQLEMFAENTIGREIADIQAVLREVEENTSGQFGEVYSGAIGLVGHSRGGGTAILAARGNDKVKAVCTWAGVADLGRFADRVDEWNEKGVIYIENARTGQQMPLNKSILDDYLAHKDDYNVIEAVKTLTPGLLVCHAEDDPVVPAAEAQQLFDAGDDHKDYLYITPEGGHTFGCKHPFEGSEQPLENVLVASMEWLERHLNC